MENNDCICSVYLSNPTQNESTKILKNFADQKGSVVQALNEQTVKQKKIRPVINENGRLGNDVVNHVTLTRNSKWLMDEFKEALEIWKKET